METVKNQTQKHTTIALLLATALAGCDGQEAKQPEETIVVPKVAEAEHTSAHVIPTTPNPAPVAQEPVVQSLPPETLKPAVVLSSDNTGLVNVAQGKIATQSGDGSPETKASLAVDGNVDGDINHGSVTHTTLNPNAWLEVDLGKSERIDHIVIFNRTDGSQQRLSNYWIFISDKPFSPNDTVENLKKVRSVTAIKGGAANPSFTTPSAVTKGRYVRVQLDGSSNPNNAFLHIAELEVYRAK